MSEFGYVLQWNMGCPHARGARQPDPHVVSRRCNLIQTAINDHRPTFVALQEVPAECVRQFRGTLARRYEILEGQQGLVTLYESNNWRQTTSTAVQAGRGMLASLAHRTRRTVIRVWNVHLVSHLRTEKDDKDERARLFCDVHLRRQRDTAPNATELIVGDFNFDPEDLPVKAQGGFWANASLEEAARAEKRARRNPDLRLYRPLFNPMWELRGRRIPPLGTTYRAGSTAHGPWYIHDQTIMSPAHGIPREEHVHLIEGIGSVYLWSNSDVRQPDAEIGSDHYPLLVKFKLE